MRTMKLSEARERMATLADPVESTVLTKNGKPVSVVLGIEAYQSMRAMLDLARDPRRYASTLRAHMQVQAGDLSQTLSLDALESQLEDLANMEKDGQNGEVHSF